MENDISALSSNHLSDCFCASVAVTAEHCVFVIPIASNCFIAKAILKICCSGLSLQNTVNWGFICRDAQGTNMNYAVCDLSCQDVLFGVYPS